MLYGGKEHILLVEEFIMGGTLYFIYYMPS